MRGKDKKGKFCFIFLTYEFKNRLSRKSRVFKLGKRIQKRTKLTKKIPVSI